MVKRSPHPSHRVGRELGVRPRRRRTPSRNSSAERSEPLSRLGRVESHAPVAADRRMRRFSIGRDPSRIASNLSSVAWRCCAFAVRRPREASCRCSVAQRAMPSTRDLWRSFVLAVEAAKQNSPVVVGSGMPNPPMRVGSASARSGRSLATSSIEESRRAGRKTVAIAASSGAKAGAMSGVSRAGGTATPIGVTATARHRLSAGTSAPPPRGGGLPQSTAGLEGPPKPPPPRRIRQSLPRSDAPPLGGS